VHLVGIIMRIYHDAPSPERQKRSENRHILVPNSVFTGWRRSHKTHDSCTTLYILIVKYIPISAFLYGLWLHSLFIYLWGCLYLYVGESAIVLCVMMAGVWSSGLTPVWIMWLKECWCQMSLRSHIISVYLSESPGSFLTTGRSDWWFILKNSLETVECNVFLFLLRWLTGEF
jgi:hypothetical protein